MPILFLLFFGHALADYPLQGEFLAKGKNHRNPIAGYPWWIMWFMHSLIHAGFVALITGSFFLGMVELAAHMFIDFLKCDGRIGFKTDQFLHLFCKFVYVIALFFGVH